MSGITDEKILALIAKVSGSSPADGEPQEEAKEIASTLPPPNYQEWIRREKLDDWPAPLASEDKLDLEGEGQFLGSQEDIFNILKTHAPLATELLDQTGVKGQALEDRLNHYRSFIFNDKSLEDENKIPNQFLLPEYVMAKAAESDMVQLAKQKKKQKKKDLKAQILGSKTKSVEGTSYPGFNAKELTELPHQVEAPQILDRVTQAQSFNIGFKKFWKKLFLSEASVAILSDSFWWFFIDMYEPDRIQDQDRLFNRIADSFVALFMSVNPDIKDKFFAVYADCFAQAMFATFYECFPDSGEKEFDTDFKRKLCNMCHEWITGVKPPPLSWKNWNMKGLQPIFIVKEKEEQSNRVVLIKDGQINQEANFEIDVEAPPKQLRRLETLRESGTFATPWQQDSNAYTKSCQVGAGAEFERVKFSATGRSPLVAHYLYMRDLANNKKEGINLRRTEVQKLPPPGPTYQDVIKDTRRFAKTLNTEYQKVSDMVAREIAHIEKKRVHQLREIERVREQIVKHNVDLKILSEKILDKRGIEGIVSVLNEMQEQEDVASKPGARSLTAVTNNEELTSDEED